MAVMQEFVHSQHRTFMQLAEALRRPGSTPMALTLPSDMLGDVVMHSADRLDARRRLDRHGDAFLWHHSIGAPLAERGRPNSGVPVLPFSVSLEIIVEAAARFAGWTGPAFTLDNVRASQWIIVDRDDVTLAITATWEPGTHSVGRARACVGRRRERAACIRRHGATGRHADHRDDDRPGRTTVAHA
jgi:hypothetical protein